MTPEPQPAQPGPDGWLSYHLYLSSRAGLSNTLMSLELGVVLAALSERTLVLEGNAPPAGNRVDYQGALPPSPHSRVTDLVEVPVPWCETEATDLSALPAHEWIDAPLPLCVFHFPADHLPTRFDGRSFARGRSTFATYGEAERAAPHLRLSGGTPVGPEAFQMHNFGFYSYLFYLDEEARRRVHTTLRQLRPKPPYANLARRIAADLGPFNAVHVRRGDFKKTFGVTTSIRQPTEVLDALRPHFSPSERLVILTDEEDDPFFDEIIAAYPDSLFLDRHVLANYRESLLALPHHDSIVLAFLAQQVAAASQDFIGTLTSTFSSLIQRARGSRGADERFKFLWNELPEEGAEVERGSHPPSECVPLDQGVMIEEFLGPYSWNRVSPRIDPSWMREWPESFLEPAAQPQER